MRPLIDIITNISNKIHDNPERNAAFSALADAQRGAPEMAMLNVQHANIGGVINYLVEHVGDLTHRMAQYPSNPNYYSGYELVLPKIRRSINMLDSAYGFEKEVEQNFVNNAAYKNIEVGNLKKKVAEYLARYAEAHDDLPVYNEAQWLAREAAVALGYMNWKRALQCLQNLNSHLDSREQWDEFASPFDPSFTKK